MVRIEDSGAQDSLKIKADKLEEIAKDSLKFMKPIVTRVGDYALGINTDKELIFVIYCNRNEIWVRSQSYFDQAVGLAKIYEVAFPDIEFTIKKG